MQKTSKPIVTYTADELAAMRARGESGSNWSAAAKQPIPDGSNPDDAIDDIDWVTINLPEPRRKAHASIRIDADVLDWFRGQGKGYQTKINAILRHYFEQNAR